MMFLQALSCCLEAATRFELVNNGFAGRCLTTWLCRRWISAKGVLANFRGPKKNGAGNGI